ncbi:Type I restriction enzyme R protein N terminus (HSDR_N) [Flavobacteriaceae bacterium MAR_2010_188]|nr:Type I restriction enzyme R protein N terminus (HSDR_N) [Flavobacteriaceae bacterium MAR_2010_188]
MQKLDFPEFSFRFKNSENKISIFDEVRKKFIILQPEEWVRQHCVKYLHSVKKYPYSLINVEKELTVNKLKKRYDIVVFHSDGSINIVVECKSYNVPISQDTFDQIARYNSSLDADFLMVTNGLNHYYCKMDFEAQCYNFLRQLPEYDQSPTSKQIN